MMSLQHSILSLTSLLMLTERCIGFRGYNVLLIIVDDLRPSLGIYGDKNAYTPNIDQLGKDGVIFSKAYAQIALCGPSRNSFLTSRRPDTLKLYDFYNYWRTFSGNFTTLPQYFKENSYITKSIGKVFHPGKSSNFTDDYPLSWSEPAWHPFSEKFKNSPVCVTEEGWFSNLICPVRTEEQPCKTLPDIESANEACRFFKLRAYDRKEFFLAVGFHKPHIPLKFPRKFLDYHHFQNVSLPKFRRYPPELPEVAWNPWTDIRSRHDISELNLIFPFQEINDYWTKKIRQSYFAAVSYVDSLIGQLLNCLKSTSFDRNTIVALTADHGWSLGEHGEWSKYSNFDVALRVPLIIRIPNLTFSVNNIGRSNKPYLKGPAWNHPVELLDLFPTIVDLARLPAVQKCPRRSENKTLCTEGKSLVPLIEKLLKRKLGSIKRGTLQFEKYALSQYPRPGNFPTRHPNSDKPKLEEIKIMGYSIRTDRYRYTEWIDWSPITFKKNWSNVYSFELYDHKIDPDENINLASRPRLEDLKKNLQHLLRTKFGADI